MAIQEYEFEGTVKWAQVQRPDKKYGDYRLQFYPGDADTRKAVKATGTMCKVKEDDDGFFYTFRSEIQPSVTDAAGNPFAQLIGNGSSAAVRITVEKFVSQQHGDVARTKLKAVIVTKLIPYEKKETPAATATVTTEEIPS